MPCSLQTSSCSMSYACKPPAVCLQGLHANLSTPTALQIGARPFDEATLFEIGYAYEQLVSPMPCMTCWLHLKLGQDCKQHACLLLIENLSNAVRESQWLPVWCAPHTSICS